jgi:hypothetical protein
MEKDGSSHGVLLVNSNAMGMFESTFFVGLFVVYQFFFLKIMNFYLSLVWCIVPLVVF